MPPHPTPHLSASALKSLNKTPERTFRLPSNGYSVFAWHNLSLNSTVWALDLSIVLLFPTPRRAMFPRQVPWRDVQISDLCGCKSMCALEGSGWYALSRRKTTKLLWIIKQPMIWGQQNTSLIKLCPWKIKLCPWKISGSVSDLRLS